MSATLYKAVCARLLQVDFTERINICCLCLGTLNQSGVSVYDEVVLDLPNQTRPEATTVLHMLKFLMDDSITDVMLMLKSVCKECMVAAINSFKFIQCCHENAKIVTSIVDNLQESFDDIPQKKINNCNSLYIAVESNVDRSENVSIKRYYDKHRLFIPQDTAFLRFNQISEIATDKPETPIPTNKPIQIVEMDDSIQELMCCKKNISVKDLLNDPNKPQEYKCRVCQEIFTHNTQLRVHFFRIHRNNKIKCKKCSPPKYSNFINFANVAIKKRTVSENLLEEKDGDADDNYEESAPFEVTEIVGPEQSENQKKMLAILKDISEPVVKSEDGMKQHGIFVCKKCNMKFSTRNRYIRHILTKNYKCKRPPKGFGEFKCDDCGFAAFYKFKLAQHMRFKHLGVKAFVCNYCGRNCNTKNELVIHTVKHTKEKRFTCDQCGRQFGTVYGLKLHKTIHTGERPYTCHICLKGFRMASYLSEHFKRHHEPATLKCTICTNRFFKFKKDLERHEARHLDHNSMVSKKYRKELEMQNEKM